MMTTTLLPNEPRVPDWDATHALTERFLQPALAELQALFLWVRAGLNASLREAKPFKHGKPYPLGQCLEISQAVQRRLRELDAASLPGEPAAGYRALGEFIRHGGKVRQVWGDLRGEYFQNAFLAGTLYIDASNDTVNPAKPPVEILPLTEADFRPIADCRHFARVASRYWNARVHPNHALPALAPYFPMITVSPAGGVQLQAASDYMIALMQAGDFRPSEDVLRMPPMSAELLTLIAKCLAASSLALPATPEQGRAAALAACAAYRERGLQHSVKQREAAVNALMTVNRQLQALKVRGKDQAPR